MIAPVILTVTQLNMYIKSCFDSDENLLSVFIAGEISNFTNHYKSGHLYFSLKDEKCAIKAVMFSQYARRLRFLPEDGMCVIVRGRVSVYEVSGQYQLYVEDLQPDGLGALNLAYEQLKAKLSAEGLFREERKRPIPRYPERIGVITSPTGAAVHDIQQILERRWPLAQIVFCPVLVQGEGAAPQIAGAIRRFNQDMAADVLIVGRGGGSAEDLWAFNEESVARAVAESKIPVISAVGHETDFTICDFVADLRAPTPSAAAELAAPDRMETINILTSVAERMKYALQNQIGERKKQLDLLMESRVLRYPEERISVERMKVDALSEQMGKQMQDILKKENTELSTLAAKLSALNPLQVLARGYSVVKKENGEVVTDIIQVENGENVKVELQEGRLLCKVLEKQRKEESVHE